MIFKPKNHGVIEGRRPRDFVAGVLPYEVRIPDGNWKPYLPPGEWQKSNLVDTMACVSFSLINCIETQELFLTGKQINYSDRWLALMSGTTPGGNSLSIVADTVRKYGLVKEESWPAPANFTWGSYYEVPSPEKMAQLKAEGQQWLKSHKLDYEWLGIDLNSIMKHLKHCPLQVVKPGHAIEGFNQVLDVHHYFDTYSPFEKKIKYTGLSDVLKPLLTITQMSTVEFVKIKGTQEYGFLESTTFTRIFHRAINETDAQFMSIKFGVPANYMSAREIVL